MVTHMKQQNGFTVSKTEALERLIICFPTYCVKQ